MVLVFGTWGEMMAHTCFNGASDTKIAVFKGGHDSPKCIGANDDTCGSKSAVSWQFNYRQVYRLLVYGPETPFNSGSFSLSVETKSMTAARMHMDHSQMDRFFLSDTSEATRGTIECDG